MKGLQLIFQGVIVFALFTISRWVYLKRKEIDIKLSNCYFPFYKVKKRQEFTIRTAQQIPLSWVLLGIVFIFFEKGGLFVSGISTYLEPNVIMTFTLSLIIPILIIGNRKFIE